MSRLVVPVVVDTREQTPWRFPTGEFSVYRQGLRTGDYAVAGYSCVTAIERKELGDFVACCTHERERFLREMLRMIEIPHRAVIVEASADDIFAHTYRSAASPKAVMATAMAITADYGTPVILAGDRRNAAWCAAWLLRRWHEHLSSSQMAATCETESKSA